MHLFHTGERVRKEVFPGVMEHLSMGRDESAHPLKVDSFREPPFVFLRLGSGSDTVVLHLGHVIHGGLGEHSNHLPNVELPGIGFYVPGDCHIPSPPRTRGISAHSIIREPQPHSLMGPIQISTMVLMGRSYMLTMQVLSGLEKLSTKSLNPNLLTSLHPSRSILAVKKLARDCGSTLPEKTNFPAFNDGVS